MYVWAHDQIHSRPLEGTTREKVRYLISSPGIIILEASAEGADPGVAL